MRIEISVTQYLSSYSGRVMLGETNPRDSKPGTIRGDFCIQVSELFIFKFHIASRKPETLVVYLEYSTVLYHSYTPRNSSVWCQVLFGRTTKSYPQLAR